MKCSCGGDTAVTETRTVDGILRRRRRCKVCEYVFWSKEIFDRDVRPPPTPKPKQLYTNPEAAAIKKKKVDARRKSEVTSLKRRIGNAS